MQCVSRSRIAIAHIAIGYSEQLRTPRDTTDAPTMIVNRLDYRMADERGGFGVGSRFWNIAINCFNAPALPAAHATDQA
jgi:hypothetical protein